MRLRFNKNFARFENREFVTNEQLANAMLPQNTGFDQAGRPTIIVDSKINRPDEPPFASSLPADNEPPF